MAIAPTSATAPDDWIDLADRAGDGLRIKLLWSRSTGRVNVTVVHVPSGNRADIDVPPAEALTAFYHPFAYRAETRHRPVATAAEAASAVKAT